MTGHAPGQDQANNLVLMGRFGAAHGVRGEIRLQSFTANPADIAAYGPLCDETGECRFVLASLRSLGRSMFVARVEGVSDRKAAESLTGVSLYLRREALPEPEEDEFYLADLEGLRAETPQGARVGRVAAIVNYGAGDILEIAPPEGETILLPFTKAAAPIVDIASGRIVVVLPEEPEKA